MTLISPNHTGTRQEPRLNGATWFRLSAKEWWHLLLLLAVIVTLFILRGHWGTEGNPDTVAVGVAAWQLANAKTLDLSDFESIADNQTHLDRWYVFDRQGRIVSNRAPGLIALATPAYLAWPDRDFTNAPATLVALILTTLAIVVSWRVFTRLVDVRFATVAAAILALGTTTWIVSASEMWPHGPDQFWAAMVAAAVCSGSYSTAGVAFAISVTTRPVTAVFAAVTGIGEGWRLRSFKPVIRIGLISTLGLAALMAYNRWRFGTWDVRGGYSANFTSGAVERFDLMDYVANVLQMFIGGRHGFLVVSPILGLSLYGALRTWKQLPGWSKTLAYAALGYLLFHAFLNRASAGMTAYYRYPLEAIVLAGPFLLLGAYALWSRGKGWRSAVVGASLVSVALIVLEPAVLCALEQSAMDGCFGL